MKRFIEKARKIHRSQKGFTLIELLVVMSILAILVGLIMPNFFGIADDGDATAIIMQHNVMRTAVFMYHMDTGEWPTEHSHYAVDNHLWDHDITGWDGPYLDRPIWQVNRWGGNWGVRENRLLTGAAGGAGDYTVLLHANVPRDVAQEIDDRIDDGVHSTGLVQFYGVGWGTGPPDDNNFLSIKIACQG